MFGWGSFFHFGLVWFGFGLGFVLLVWDFLFVFLQRRHHWYSCKNEVASSAARTLGCNLVTSRMGATKLHVPGYISDHHSPLSCSFELICISLKLYKIQPSFHLLEVKKEGGRTMLEFWARWFGESVWAENRKQVTLLAVTSRHVLNC